MTTRTIASVAATFDENGYMCDSSQWSLEVARALAAEEGLPFLSDRHVAVLNAIRQEFHHHGILPASDRLAHVSGVPVKELHALFPGRLAKTAARIAGIRNPAHLHSGA